MRRLGIALSLAFASLLLVSNCFAGKGSWDAVENLPPGTNISIQPIHGTRFRCEFESANEYQIVCEQPERPLPCLSCILFPGVTLPQPVTYQPILFDRKYVRQIHIEHPYQNAALGVAIGAGAGAALGAKNNHGVDRTTSQVVSGVLLGTVGGFIGKHVPLIRGTAVYEK